MLFGKNYFILHKLNKKDTFIEKFTLKGNYKSFELEICTTYVLKFPWQRYGNAMATSLANDNKKTSKLNKIEFASS
ncbi:MAG: hypothetical protein AB9856_17825 [Cellulosilyticaceae bacterium]